MLSLLTQSISNASFAIYFPKFTGTIYELLSAPVSYFEITLSYVGAAATKSMILAAIILLTAGFFVPLKIDHPLWMLTFQIGRATVCTPVTNAHLVCRLLLDKQNKTPPPRNPHIT